MTNENKEETFEEVLLQEYEDDYCDKFIEDIYSVIAKQKMMLLGPNIMVYTLIQIASDIAHEEIEDEEEIRGIISDAMRDGREIFLLNKKEREKKENARDTED